MWSPASISDRGVTVRGGEGSGEVGRTVLDLEVHVVEAFAGGAAQVVGDGLHPFGEDADAPSWGLAQPGPRGRGAVECEGDQGRVGGDRAERVDGHADDLAVGLGGDDREPGGEPGERVAHVLGRDHDSHGPRPYCSGTPKFSRSVEPTYSSG